MRTLKWCTLLLAVSAGRLTAQSGVFVIRSGSDTVAVESFTRSAVRLVGRIAMRSPVRALSYEAELMPDGLVPAIRGEITQADRPPVSYALTFRGDSVIRLAPGGSGAEQHLDAGQGAMPYAQLSGALLEQVVRRARGLGGKELAIPMVMVGGSRILKATVTLASSDSATIALTPMLKYVVRLDAAGRMLSASVPAQSLVIELRP